MEAPNLIPPKALSHAPVDSGEASTSTPSLASVTLLDLTGHITRENDYPSAHGGSADIWMGIWTKGSENRKVHLYIIFYYVLGYSDITSP